MGEDRVPIMIATAHKRQLHAPRVGKVRGDVQPILEEPHTGSSQPNRLPFAQEINTQNDRKNQLADGSAIRLKPSAEQANDGVACLVEKQVCMVDHENKTRLGTE